MALEGQQRRLLAGKGHHPSFVVAGQEMKPLVDVIFQKERKSPVFFDGSHFF